MTTKLNDQDILRACEWYAHHSEHVDTMMSAHRRGYPPSASDCHQPMLWSGKHWKWLLAKMDIKILAKEITRLKCLLKTVHDTTDPDRFANEDWWNDIEAVVKDEG